MKKSKTLCEYLTEGDYASFLRFIHSSHVLAIEETDECDFYRNATKRWAKTLLNSHAPSPAVERVIMLYHSSEMISFTAIKWNLYPSSLIWAFAEAPIDVAQKVLDALRYKPATEVEVAMLKRADLELLKAWLDKFNTLDEESEALINDDQNLSSLKSYYIDRAIARSL